jgi:hypothetical protein
MSVDNCQSKNAEPPVSLERNRRAKPTNSANPTGRQARSSHAYARRIFAAVYAMAHIATKLGTVVAKRTRWQAIYFAVSEPTHRPSGAGAKMGGIG